jgi:hypothetical protein
LLVEWDRVYDPDSRRQNEPELEGQTMMYDLEPFYRDDEQETGTGVPLDPVRGALRYEAGGGGWRLGDIDLSEVLTRADGHDASILVAYRGQVREVPVQCTCNVCGCPLDDIGVCPRCQLRAMLMAGRLRAQRQRELLLREIEQIVEASWQD